jgi:hypothetical protein
MMLDTLYIRILIWCTDIRRFGATLVLSLLGMIICTLKTTIKKNLFVQWQPVAGRQKQNKLYEIYSRQHTVCVLHLAGSCKYSVTLNLLMNLTHNACTFKHIYVQHGCFMSKQKVRKFGNRWHVHIISSEYCPWKSKHIWKQKFTLLRMFFSIARLREATFCLYSLL